MKKFIYITIGLISLTLGIIGLFLPIIPTTPFLLLSTWLFLRSSQRLYNWLTEHPVLGIYIKSYIKYKGIRKTHKIIAISTLWITMSISIFLLDKIIVKVILFTIASIVTFHILSFKTLTKEEIENIEKMEGELKTNPKHSESQI